MGLWAPPQESTPEKRAEDRQRILAWFLEQTGTAHECCNALGMLHTTGLPRIAELHKAGCLVKVPGVRRKTGSGGTAAVWIVTLAGRNEARG